jgi:Carboxypeptidase regulatory-like domain/TonB dependent receptor
MLEGFGEIITMRHIRWAWAIAFIILAVPGHMWGQAVGIITGTVTDSSGSVIPHASVSALRTDTGVSQTTSTNDSGIFSFPHLLVGTYSVTVTAPGFETATVANIALDVSQQRDLPISLSVAGGTQTAEVTDAPPMLNTSNGQMSGLVTSQQVENLPLNGRSIQNLVMLQPGMAADQGGMGWMSPQWASNGNRGETEVAQLDGADATDAEMGTVQFWNFNLDAIAEFKVLQANYSAEFGQGGGTITQIVTKSGTNQFHGSTYEYIRNNDFDARNYFSTTVPPYHRNEFGAEVGGPILKNKLFFEGEYAGLRQILGEPTIVAVPTAAERTGLVSLNGYQYQVPVNSVAASVLNAYPLPNQPGGLYGANTYNLEFSQPTLMNQFSIRIDDTLSAHDSIFGRVSYINNSEEDTDPVAAIENPLFSAAIFNDPRNYAIGETHTFTPNLLSSFLLAFNRQVEGYEPGTDATTQTTFSDGSYASYGPDSFMTKYVENYYDPSFRLAWSKGRHMITTGFQFRYGQDNGTGVSGGGPSGEYGFDPGTPLPQALVSTDGGPTIAAGTGSPSGKISMMEGADYAYSRSTPMTGYGPAGGLVEWGLRVWNLAGYFQDDFKASDKLTLNLGVRYEYQSVPYEIRDRLAAIVDQGPLTGHMVINPKPLYQPDRWNFVPRLGFAYRAANKTVLRGGFAIFTNTIPTVYPDQSAVDFPMATGSTLTNAPYSLTPLPVTLPALMSTTGVVMPPNGNTTQIPVNTPVNLAPVAADIGTINGDWASEELKNGSTMNGNITLEQQLPSGMVFTVSGVTTDSDSLYNSRFPNGYYGATPANAPYSQVTPGLGEIYLIHNQGVVHYLGLQTQLRKDSPSHGVQFQVNYTWDQDLTDSDSVFSGWTGQDTGQANSAMSLNNPTCVTCEYGRANNLVKERLAGNFSYNIPGNWGPAPRILSRGWQALGIYNIQSGSPFTIVSPYGTEQYGIDISDGNATRPFFVQTAPRNSQHGNPQFFSDAAVANEGMNGTYWSVPTGTNPTLGTVQTGPGNLGRNTYVGPGWWNLDFSLVKNTAVIRDRGQLQLRADFFNIFNHTTFATPNSALDTPVFGYSTATASSERQIQFGARLMF